MQRYDERKGLTIGNMDQNVDIRIAQLVVLVTEKLAKLLLTNVMFRQRDILPTYEATPSSFINIPRHIGGCQDQNTTSVAFFLLAGGLFTTSRGALKI